MQTFTGTDYLRIALANHYGKDKLTWNERLIWFFMNEDKLEDLVDTAEEPTLFYGALQAYRKAEEGIPSGYPITLDATASGIQILTCLTRDKVSAKVCNVIDIGHRADAYTELFEHMLSKVKSKRALTRHEVKTAIMTVFYGSEDEPKKAFGIGELLETFYQTLEEKTPDPYLMNQIFLEMWNPRAIEYNWILPDGFHVKDKVIKTVEEKVTLLGQRFPVNLKKNLPKKKGRSLSANIVHSVDGLIVREMLRRCSHNPKTVARVKRMLLTYTPKNQLEDTDNVRMVLRIWNLYKESGFLSTRILDYLDTRSMAIVDPKIVLDLIETLPEKPFEVLTVHDCFRCLPNYGNDLRRQYNQILSDITKSEMLPFLIQQITEGIKIELPNNNMHEDVLKANYALS